MAMETNGSSYVLKINEVMTSAAWSVIAALEPKGRVETRNHGRVQRELKAKAMKMEDAFKGDFLGGTLQFDEDRFDYLRRIVMKKMEAGYVGIYADGMDQLMDLLDNVYDEHRVAEKAAEKAEVEKSSNR